MDSINSINSIKPKAKPSSIRFDNDQFDNFHSVKHVTMNVLKHFHIDRFATFFFGVVTLKHFDNDQFENFHFDTSLFFWDQTESSFSKQFRQEGIPNSHCQSVLQ